MKTDISGQEESVIAEFSILDEIPPFTLTRSGLTHGNSNL